MCRLLSAILLCVLIAALPQNSGAANKENKKSVEKKIDNLKKEVVDSQNKTFDTITKSSNHLKSRLEHSKKNLIKPDDRVINLDLKRSNVQDIEKTRIELRRKIQEWTLDIDGTSTEQLKTAIADALVVADADGLDREKLTLLYDRMKAVVRTTYFRESEATIDDRMKNLDLEWDATDQRLRELQTQYETLKKEMETATSENSWSREMRKLDLLAIVVEILQHKMNVRHEDIAKPLYIAMDGILSGFVWLGQWSSEGKRALQSSGLEDHKFDSEALFELPKQYVQKLVTLGFEGEALAAEARAARQRHRMNFYKRSAIAYIRALISAKDTAGYCSVENMVPIEVEFDGEKIKTLGCPDPVVQNLRAYLDAFRKLESAEADRLMAEAEKLVAQQQIIADFMAAVPVVGDVLDAYSVWAGETLYGEELSPIERGLMGVLVALPIVGPHAIKQIEVRAPESVLAMLEGIKAYLKPIIEFGLETAGDIGAARREIARFMTEDFAEIAGVNPEALKRLYRLLKEPGGIIDEAARLRKERFEAARARMRYFQTVREAAEDRIALATLRNSEEFGEIYRRAMHDSDQLMERNLIGYYNGGSHAGSWEQRAGASNIPKPMLREFEAFSESNRQAIVFRPVGPDPADKIAQNLAATKPLGIKPKSSNWGPQNSFIPVEQRFSKLGNPKGGDISEIAKYEAKVKACLSKTPPCANTVPLTIEVNKENFEVMIMGKKPGGQPVLRDGKGVLRDSDTLTPLMGRDIDTSELRPMVVFADEYGNPLTADFDLLAVGSQRPLDAPPPGRGVGYDPGAQRRAPARRDPKVPSPKKSTKSPMS